MKVFKKVLLSIGIIILTIVLACSFCIFFPVAKNEDLIGEIEYYPYYGTVTEKPAPCFKYNNVPYREYVEPDIWRDDYSKDDGFENLIGNLISKNPCPVKRLNVSDSKYNTLAGIYGDRQGYGWYQIGSIVLFICVEAFTYYNEYHMYFPVTDKAIPNFFDPNSISNIAVYCGSFYDNNYTNDNFKYISILSRDWKEEQAKLLEIVDDNEFIQDFVKEYTDSGELVNAYNAFCQKYGRNDIFFEVVFKDDNFPFSLLIDKYTIGVGDF